MNHSFNVDLAIKYGTEEAIILENLAFWIKKNQANDKHLIDGHYWTYNSSRALKELFPYMSEKKIQRTLKKLEELNIIKTNNYNKSLYDRTKWYTIIDQSICHIYTIHLPKLSNRLDTGVQPIPDINTSINSNINNNTITSNEVNSIIEKFNTLFSTKYRVTQDRSKKIKLRLKVFSLEEILQAIQNLKSSPFHNGDNDRSWTADIDFLIRNDQQIDKFLNNTKIQTKPYTDNIDLDNYVPDPL